MLIDTHAHLTSNQITERLDEVLRSAHEAGVEKIISIACDIEDSQQVIDLSAKHDEIYPTVGIHPCYVHELEEQNWVDQLHKLANSAPVCAIGEIGLDYFHKPPGDFTVDQWRTLQKEYFINQLNLAGELDLPVVIHQRESGDDVLAILKDFPHVSAVLHCFTGTRQQAETALEMGHYISFTGVVTFPKATEVKEIAAFIPDDRIMVETDSPYLAPVPFRGKKNEPAYVSYTAEEIANLRGMPADEFASITTANAISFFANIEAK